MSLTANLKPFRVLCVCTANVCRSPAAQTLLQRSFDDAGIDAVVTSAGVRAADGIPMDEAMTDALRAAGHEPSEIVSRALTPVMVDEADLVLTATVEHRSAVLSRSPRALRKAFTLKEFAAAPIHAPVSNPGEAVATAAAARGAVELRDRDIEDPHGLAYAAYQRTVRELESATEAIAHRLAGNHTP
ncbi:low molecular weight phosphatase family protein [Epidermidibacterium keratini]|uniref:Low molecular weight phosphatase family protein n=1 Tax=Epidermidibacterium keratini TaxID=1891644 RepID=A0A7L4YQY6_9ACTN|nr:low molecular weight phosphatase family protein [Epidermidibacterium keratini]QHC01472.1 low molecular weight phosphatase family protein [Epidermidibacterium keratini]